jgi:uncharacterized membrane protein (DUF106 family)
MESWDLNEKDAYAWIENSLEVYEEQTIDQSTLNKIDESMEAVNKKQKSASKYTDITR